MTHTRDNTHSRRGRLLWTRPTGPVALLFLEDGQSQPELVIADPHAPGVEAFFDMCRASGIYPSNVELHLVPATGPNANFAPWSAVRVCLT